MKISTNIFIGILCLIVIIEKQYVFGENLSDTLQNYNKWSTGVFYKSSDILSQAARFDIARPCYLNQVEITLAGMNSSGTALVHVYGHEGGAPVPILEKDLIEPVLIHKTKSGIENVVINLGNNLEINNNQFFIAVDQFSNGINILSDRIEKKPSCSSEQGGQYYYQLLKKADGTWAYGKYGYAIKATVEYIEQSEKAYFKDISDSCGINDTMTVNQNIALSDINKDGYTDCMVGGHIYINNGDETFTEITEECGIEGKPLVNIFIDINCDGKTDILFLGLKDDSTDNKNILYIQGNENNFKKEYLFLPDIIEPSSYSLADVNSDLFPDLFIAQSDTNGIPLENYLLINDRKNGFYNFRRNIYDISDSPRISRGCAWFDYDNDGDMDLYVVNDNNPDELWENNGELSFLNVQHKLNKKITEEYGDTGPENIRYGRGIDWADINNDNQMDLILPAQSIILNTNREINGTKLLKNQRISVNSSNDKTGLFKVDFEEEHSGGCFGDFNNDGLQDVILTTACKCRYADLYIQNKVSGMKIETNKSGFERRSLGKDLVAVDINNDGYLDFITLENKLIKVYKNTGEYSDNNNYIDFDLADNSGDTPVGSIVEVHCGENKYRQLVSSGHGLMMQKPLRLHFGLGKESVDSVVVYSPLNPFTGKSFKNFTTNSINSIEVDHDVEKDNFVVVHSSSPNPFSENTSIIYQITYPGNVEISIYTLDGDLIKSFVSEYHKAGEYKVLWDGKDEHGSETSSGTYIYLIKSKNKEYSGRIVKID